MSTKKYLLACISCIFFMVPYHGYDHDMRPALLQIKQTGTNEYEVLWKIPRRENEVIAIKPLFPSWFVAQQKIPAIESGTGALYTFSATSTKDIHGMPISINGIEGTMVDVLVQLEFLNGEQYAAILRPDKKSMIVPASFTVLDTIKSYITLGINHILTGIDHLLFVLALLLITKGTRRLLITISAFTLAHSITLSLSALGYVGLPGPPVEAVIALSIVFLAWEIILDQKGVPTLTSRKPWVVAFTFGLLHGLGFASALAAVGLPQQHIPLALAFFNVGVELGQLMFVAVVLLIIKVLSMKKEWPLILKKIPAYSIGSMAAFWLIERVVAFWN
ncbi:MAG TPA: HupE/UreJ family protein [Panacibacter sp.]|nr:HupE/UreJ family protein [Panacibacter sp.]